MFYDKKIKYLDYYEGGQRARGCGYVKLEARNGSLRLEMTITGLRPTDSFERDVLFFSGGQEKAVGKIQISGGRGSWKKLWDQWENIGGSGIDYRNLGGITIPLGNGREITCSWQEENGVRRKAGKPSSLKSTREKGGLEPGKPSLESVRGESPEAPTDIFQRSTQKRSAGTAERPGDADYSGRAEIKAAELESSLKAGGRESGKTERRLLQNSDGRQPVEVPDRKERAGDRKALEYGREGTGGDRKALEYGREGTGGDRKALEYGLEGTGGDRKALEYGREGTGGDRKMPGYGSPGTGERAVWGEQADRDTQKPGMGRITRNNRKQIRLLEDKWAQLWSIYPHIKPFQDEREYISIGPADFVLFPEASYRMVNNSFLLHGFYNYDHLILARMEKKGERFYYIGVPGNFFEKEKQVAIMFGFESFECAEEPAQAGDFGYYMMRTGL